MNETTFIRPKYYRTSAGHKVIDGIQFFSYSVGVLQYARISENGQIWTSDTSRHADSYRAAVIGHGQILGSSGKTKRFRSEEAAAREAIKVWRKMQEQKP